jgi:hypothetical protein
MIGHQVAGKATRDALFLSNFDVTNLPLMLIVTSLVSIVVVLVTAQVITRVGPAVFVPWAFGVSAFLTLLEWWLCFYSPGATAIAVYLHLGLFGSVLVSGFWSIINEKFDPRSGKKLISRIATGATLGGFAGGLFAERVAAGLSVTAMLPLLAILHVACSVGLRFLRADDQTERHRTRPGSVSGRFRTTGAYRSSVQILKTRRYLRSLALLVLLGTVSAALLDYVFKAQASAEFTDAETLLRFFAIYYTAIGLVTVIFQGSFTRISLEKLGLARTVAALPAGVAVGALGAILAPRLTTTTIARGAEAVLRNSMYRSAYELLYTPVPPYEKRATKSVIDVGFERLGDAFGGGITRLILYLVPVIAHPVMLVTAVVIAGAGLLVGRQLNKGYVLELERSLQNRAVELDLSDVEDKTTRQTLAHTMAALKIDPLKTYVSRPEVKPKSDALQPLATRTPKLPKQLDPVIQRIVDLQSKEPARIRKILEGKPLEPGLIAHVIDLLAWDEVARDAIIALRKVASENAGQMIDALLRADRAFAIRRRLPRVLSAVATQRTADGLLLGLEDRRFEVRFQCGKALSYLKTRNPKISIKPEEVQEAVLREVAVDRRVWKSHRLLDRFEESEQRDPFVDEYLRDRANRSLEHVFTLLSLVFPKEPLRIAFRGIHTTDRDLRGTALEYLESILPAKIRESLWPFLEDDRKAVTETPKSREEILDELLKSSHSIQLSLEEIRREIKEED